MSAASSNDKSYIVNTFSPVFKKKPMTEQKAFIERHTVVNVQCNVLLLVVVADKFTVSREIVFIGL